jgi:Mn-dependent DtxR family transcriptional regulator
MELLEEELLVALCRAPGPIGGLDLSLAVGVSPEHGYPALHRLIRGGYAHEHKRLYTPTRSGRRLARRLARDR